MADDDYNPLRITVTREPVTNVPVRSALTLPIDFESSGTPNSVAPEWAQKLFGIGQERYQLWPERMARSGATAPGDAYAGKLPVLDNEGRTNQELIERVQDTAGLAGLGGIGAGPGSAATLGSGPSLRPALKYKEKIYKGKEGEEHPVPEHLRSDFERKALSGEDINDYNFGWVNHKGQFLSREKALDYAIEQGLLDKDYGKFGALTSTMLEDSRAATAIAGVNQSGYYSGLGRAVASAKLQKGTEAEWKNYLKNQSGVKSEELELGLEGFKGGTKNDLIKHIEENGVKLGEVWKGSRDTGITQRDPDGTILPTTNETKYSSYTLPGGENYRELLLTLPEKSKTVKWDDVKHLPNEQLFRHSSDNPNVYKSSHWDEPNVLAHIRMNDRDIPNVGKTLHIEEIQSDFMQAYRKESMKVKEAVNKHFDTIADRMVQAGVIKKICD